MISVYDMLTIKSKSENTQIGLIEQFADQYSEPDLASSLKELAEERFPLGSDVATRDVVRLWALAIWLSDIGTVLWHERREALLNEFNQTVEKLGFDRRALVSMSGQADRAISIFDEYSK